MALTESSPLTMADVDAFGEKIIEWALAGSSVTDEPVRGFPLSQFSTAACIAVGYLIFVAVGSVLGRVTPGKGVKLYGLAFLYNIVQMMLCSYMCIEAAAVAFRNGYSLVCNTFDATTPAMSHVLWLFYISKVLDFMDTFFILVGKKWKQLSFLHVYHHFSIFLVYWLNLHVNYDGDVYLTIALNGFIHTVMYTYYFVSMHTRDIWWKKFLTLAQLAQFTCMNTQAAYILFTPGCSQSPPRVTKFYFAYIMSMFVLFMHFYLSSYSNKGVAGGAGGDKKPKRG
eukprot:CAMPEP_0118910148 /NCGR_PEP_ID=MMETSP1166-20130328/12415_1 /TAXON_ID=1104430 /ORGANISM="Chrysoreinhardia sp, Strain CCMP3193" /LENGTH=282 /DNA_ID=CAMNT_0006849601 /DNA_START=18 /DNA_END=866 /DNA_ORIENTATION=+